MDAFSILANQLSQAGLGSLFYVDAQGNPSGWLWDQIKSGVDTREALQLALEQTPEFKQRFKVIFDLRERSVRGENVAVPTTEDVLKYEAQYRAVMSRSGVPYWFYDTPEDAHEAMGRNLSIDQVSERIETSYNVVTRLPQEVREVFADYFGDASDASLVAAVLDPEKTLASLEKATRAAVAGGFARRQGFEITRPQAEEYASLNRTLGQSEADIAEVAKARPLEVAQMGEAAEVEEGDAFRARALGNVAADTQLERRLTTRRLGQAQSSGGAMTLNEGIVGAGVAR